MDCTDIVIGTARGKYSRVRDYYTRDRSTPREDPFWGGNFDLTATGGFEANGTTTIMFRKKLESSEPSDHSIVNDIMHVIWARGQEMGKYVHVPPSGLEKERASKSEFYQPDELKYHGHKQQRGFTQMNFLEEKIVKTDFVQNDCHGEWKHPHDCDNEKNECEYFVTWATTGLGKDMHFRIETTKTKTWTGIGFSNDEKMSQTDAVIGWVDNNGRPFLMDTWIVGYSSPKLDDNQDIFNASGRIQDGKTTLEFSRKRVTSDTEGDLMFTDDQCLYLLFPIEGGAFNSVNKKIRKHGQIPVVSSKRVCIKSCAKGDYCM